MAGAKVELSGGRTVTADDAYLTEAIVAPDASAVAGYGKGTMKGAIAGFGLGAKPRDVAALVAYIHSVR